MLVEATCTRCHCEGSLTRAEHRFHASQLCQIDVAPDSVALRFTAAGRGVLFAYRPDLARAARMKPAACRRVESARGCPRRADAGACERRVRNRNGGQQCLGKGVSMSSLPTDVARDAFLPAVSRPTSCYADPAAPIRLARTLRNDES